MNHPTSKESYEKRSNNHQGYKNEGMDCYFFKFLNEKTVERAEPTNRQLRWLESNKNSYHVNMELFGKNSSELSY